MGPDTGAFLSLAFTNHLYNALSIIMFSLQINRYFEVSDFKLSGFDCNCNTFTQIGDKGP